MIPRLLREGHGSVKTIKYIFTVYPFGGMKALALSPCICDSVVCISLEALSV